MSDPPETHIVSVRFPTPEFLHLNTLASSTHHQRSEIIRQLSARATPFDFPESWLSDLSPEVLTGLEQQLTTWQQAIDGQLDETRRALDHLHRRLHYFRIEPALQQILSISTVLHTATNHLHRVTLLLNRLIEQSLK